MLFRSLRPPIHVVGVHTDNNPVAILQSLRAGASEFLYGPFDLSIQKEAVTRLRRLVAPEPVMERGGGFAVAFTSSKPGSGASTLAAQTSFALARMTGKKVLLADGDLTGGTIAFYLKLAPRYSLLDGLQNVEELDGEVWRSLTTPSSGVDILPAPQEPYAEPVDASLLKALLAKAKEAYDWVVLDLPTVFQRTSLMGVSGCDMACLVSTAELPSLHLTRKAFSMIDHLGFPREILKLVANRVDKKSDFTLTDLGKLFGTKVLAKLNHDYFALHRVVTLGQPLNDGGELAKSIEALAQQIIDAKQAKKNTNSAEVDSRVVAR